MRLKIESPLSISSSLSGNINETLDYIPGTVIRGALADAFLKENDINNPNKKALFNQLFLCEEVIYNNFYIEGSMPVPFTARTCKTFSGFKRYLPKWSHDPLVRDDRHGVKDYLLPFILYEETGDIDDIKDDCAGSGNDCGLPMERYPGYCLYLSPYGYYDVPVSMREIARTEIFNKTQTSLPGILFSIEVIDEGQIFEGAIEVKDRSLISEIQKYLIREKVFSIGVGKTRGLGRVEIMSEELTHQTATPSIKDTNGESGRFGLFNQKIKEMFNSKGISNNKTFISITFISDTIIQQEDDRYLSLITPDCLGITNFYLRLSFCSTRKISGWSNVWRLPKRDDIAISKGSVFLYESKYELDSSEFSSLLSTLESLEEHGIGKRRNEGFGQISICNPFHWRGIE